MPRNRKPRLTTRQGSGRLLPPFLQSREKLKYMIELIKVIPFARLLTPISAEHEVVLYRHRRE